MDIPTRQCKMPGISLSDTDADLKLLEILNNLGKDGLC